MARRLALSSFPNHLVFYRLDMQKLTILHVLHGARNLEAVLSDITEDSI